MRRYLKDIENPGLRTGLKVDKIAAKLNIFRLKGFKTIIPTVNLNIAFVYLHRKQFLKKMSMKKMLIKRIDSGRQLTKSPICIRFVSVLSTYNDMESDS